MDFEITIERVPKRPKFLWLSGRYRYTIETSQMSINNNYYPSTHWAWTAKLAAEAECRKLARDHRNSLKAPNKFTYTVE